MNKTFHVKKNINGFKKMEEVHLIKKMFGKYQDNGSFLIKEKPLNGILKLKSQQQKTLKI